MKNLLYIILILLCLTACRSLRARFPAEQMIIILPGHPHEKNMKQGIDTTQIIFTVGYPSHLIQVEP